MIVTAVYADGTSKEFSVDDVQKHSFTCEGKRPTDIVVDRPVSAEERNWLEYSMKW